jgi:two-component system chemotaxis response regulator CheY
LASILIVDDSYIMRMKIKAMLTNAGHTVAGEAMNGEMAVMEYSQKKPDIVTMDISMPVMDGILALKMILSRFPDAKIIVISALDKKKMVYTALESGAKNYILKPVDEAKLISTINSVLKDDQPRRPIRSAGENDLADMKPFSSSDAIRPFTIDNRSGTFVINIGKALKPENFNNLANTIQGFLFVKPLSIVFNFADADEIHEEVIEGLKMLTSAIQMIKGTVRFATTNQVIQELLQDQFPGIPVMALV